MRAVTIRGRGHPNVRARHAKTIELVADADVTARGTCIVAVATALDPGRLGGLDGPVVVTLRAGGASDRVRGVANPRYDASTGRLVIRRSHHRAADTLVVDADKGSADLDRALVAALADPATTLEVTVEADEEPDDAGATEHVDADLAAAQAIAARLGSAVAGDALPVTFAGTLPRSAAERRRALADRRRLTVWQARPQDLTAVAAELGDRLVAVVTDPGTPDARVHRRLEQQPRARTAFVVVETEHASGGDRLLAALAGAGVDTKTLQDALVAATGASRRDAYDRVLRARR